MYKKEIDELKVIKRRKFTDKEEVKIYHEQKTAKEELSQNRTLRRQLGKKMKREEESRCEPTVLGVETKQVPAPSEKGLLTDVRDISIVKRKFRPRQLFIDCESRLNNEVHVTEIANSSKATTIADDISEDNERTIGLSRTSFTNYSNEIVFCDTNIHDDYTEDENSVKDPLDISSHDHTNGEFTYYENEIVFCDTNIHNDYSEDENSIKDPLDISLHNKYNEVSDSTSTVPITNYAIKNNLIEARLNMFLENEKNREDFKDSHSTIQDM